MRHGTYRDYAAGVLLASLIIPTMIGLGELVRVLYAGS